MEQFSTSKKYAYSIAGILVFLGLYLTSLYNYLLFHSLAEIFSIVVACGIFMVTWNSRRFLENNYLLLLGIAYLFVGGLDLIHTLTYKGMGIFQGYGTNLATQLWIAARYTESLSLLIAPLFFRRKLKIALLFFGYLIALLLLLISIFYWNIFPLCFVEGVGLTPFKKISEYIISLILLASIALLLKNRNEFDRDVLKWVVWSILLTIASELAFTFYMDAYGFSNLLGHFLKIVSFYLIYKALIEMGLTRPYDLLFRNLKQTEMMVREEKNKIQNYLDIAGVTLVVIDADQMVRLINKKGCQILGYEEKEIIGKNWFDAFIPEGIREEVRMTFKSLMKGETDPVEYFESPVLTKTGEERMIAWHNAVSRDGKGKVVSTLSSGEDITERKRTEEALRTSLERYRSYIEVTGELGWTTNADGEVVEDIPSFRKFTGQTNEEVKGWGWSKALHPDDLEYTTQIWRQAVKSKSNYEVEYRLRRHDGIYRYFLARGAPVFKENGSIREWVGTCIDITERKGTEDELRKSRDELELRVRERTAELANAYKELKEQSRILESFFKYTVTPLVFLDRDFNFIRVNEAYAKACRREVSEFPGYNHFEFYPSDAKAKFEQVVETREPYQAIAGPFTFPDRPEWGTSYWDWTLTPVLDDTGEVESLVFSLEDVTERKRAEEALRESENRLRALSSQLLTAQESERKRIAMELHDGIGQMLTAIKFKVESILQEKGKGEARAKEKSLEAVIPMIRESVEEVRRIQMDLRPSTLDDLGVLATLGWFCREYQKIYSHIHIEKEIGLKEDEVSTPLRTVIYRLTQEAMNNIAKHSKADLIHLSLRRMENKIELFIKDNGIGFDLEEILSSEGSKRGLGLNSMRERTELSGGAFTIESTPGKGTTVLASWPL